MPKQDVLACLKMLRARGGALDLKAAEIIEDLAGKLVGNKVEERLAILLVQTERDDARREVEALKATLDGLTSSALMKLRLVAGGEDGG